MERRAGPGFVGLGPEAAPLHECAQVRLQSPSARYFGDDGGPEEAVLAKGDPVHVSLPGGGAVPQAAAPAPAQGYFQALPFGFPLPLPPHVQGALSPAAAAFVPAPGVVAAPAVAGLLAQPVRNGLQVQIEERRAQPPRERLRQASPGAAARAAARGPAARRAPAAGGAAGAPAREASDDQHTGPSAVFVDLSGLVPKGQAQGR